MPSSSLPIGGAVYPYMFYSPSMNSQMFRHPPGPPPGSPANVHHLTIDTEVMMMVSLTKW